ncbi:hypothetical protein ACFCZY_31760 [Streptomyces sp. NPDC056237]|uniref:hypothetical protein n=1 Tax=unclassified Streptomyces TaxID=2593676 RepID=UPI0035DD8402
MRGSKTSEHSGSILATRAEHATRKGRPYGTIPMDAETRRPVDLLPDREASAA